MMDLKIKIIRWLIRKWDFLIVARDGNEGCVILNGDDESEKHLRAILCSAFRDRQEKVQDIIIGTAEDWLKCHVVEANNFIKKIK